MEKMRSRGGHAEPTRPADEPARPAQGAKQSAVEPTGHTGDDRVARRAYELYERRGGEHGRALDDWLEAEGELRNKGGR